MNFYAALHGARKKDGSQYTPCQESRAALARRATSLPGPGLSPNVPLVTAQDSARRSLNAFRRHRIAILLAITVALMTALSMEQQRVIQAQDAMIQTLSRDSFAYLHWLAEQRRQQHK